MIKQFILLFLICIASSLSFKLAFNYKENEIEKYNFETLISTHYLLIGYLDVYRNLFETSFGKQLPEKADTLFYDYRDIIEEVNQDHNETAILPVIYKGKKNFYFGGKKFIK